MAQLDLLRVKPLEKNRNTVHDKVLSTYTVFESDGEKYLQIDTYGRTDRDMPEKISQSIQFDRASAIFVVNLLVIEFNLEMK